jgi:hypothetical protein
VLLACFFTLSTTFNIVNPIWEAIDEPGHFQYVKYIAEQRRLPATGQPLPTLASGSPNCLLVRCVGRGTITTQPPLYYLLEAPFVLPINLNDHVSWVANPYFTWPDYPLRNGTALHTLTEAWPYHGMVLGVHVMRAVSGLMATATLAIIYFAMLTLTSNAGTSVLVTAMAGLTPGFLLASATITNDVGVILMSTLALFFGAKALTTRPWLWMTLFTVSAWLAWETKTSAIFLLPTGVLLLGTVWLRDRPRYRRAVRRAVELTALGVIAAALFAAAAVPTWRHLAGTFIRAAAALPRDISVAASTERCHCGSLPLQPLWGATPDLFDTYWGSFGWETFHLPPQFYPVFLVFVLAAVIGVVRLLANTGAARKQLNLTAFVVLQVSFLMLLGIIFHRNLTSLSDGGTSHARFLMPAILATSAFLGLGLMSLPRVLRRLATAGMFATCLSAIGYGLWILPRAFVNVPAYGDLSSAGAAQTADVRFANGMQLAGFSLPPERTVAPGEVFHITLFWTASARPNFDYSAFVRLNDGKTLVHDTDHAPGAGVGLLPHDWQLGEVIPDRWSVPVPPDTRLGEYAVELGVYDYRDMKPVEDSQHQAATVIARVQVVTGS